MCDSVRVNGVLLAGRRTPDGHHPPEIFGLTDDFCFPVSYLIDTPFAIRSDRPLFSFALRCAFQLYIIFFSEGRDKNLSYRYALSRRVTVRKNKRSNQHDCANWFFFRQNARCTCQLRARVGVPCRGCTDKRTSRNGARRSNGLLKIRK